MIKQVETLETLTVNEVAEILKVDPRTIYRRCKANKIPHFQDGENSSIRFLKSRIIQWIEEQHKS